LYNKSRMMGDYQVRFCERLGVKFPLPTRPRKPLPAIIKDDTAKNEKQKI